MLGHEGKAGLRFLEEGTYLLNRLLDLNKPEFLETRSNLNGSLDLND